jgi:hypothetical protein
MVTIYLVNVLHITLIYSQYTPSVIIISMPLNDNNNPWIHMEYGHSYILKIYICKSYYIELYYLEYTKYTFVYS